MKSGIADYGRFLLLPDIDKYHLCNDIAAASQAELAEKDRQIGELFGIIKTVQNQLDHLIPTVDPQMDGNEIEVLLDAVLARAYHANSVLKQAIAKHKEPK